MSQSSAARFLLALMLLPFASCTKHEIPKASTYTFTNATTRSITLDVYSSKADYTFSANRISRQSLAPNQDIRIKLDAPGNVYLDWYSSDYSFNNWGVKNSGPANTLKAETPIAIEDDHLYLTYNAYTDTARSVLMNVSGTSSVWDLVVPVTGGGYNAGTYRFVFKKDFTGQYTFTAAGGNPVVQDFHFYTQPNTNGGGYFNKAIPFSVQLYTDYTSNQPVFGFSSRSQSYPYEMTSRDTMYMYYYSSGSAGYSQLPVVRK